MPKAVPSVKDSQSADDPTLKERFRAWWEGYDLDPGRRTNTHGPSHDVRYEAGPLEWETSRIRLAEALWGEGFISPGGPDYVLSMIKFFGLDPSMSVLDLGAGLGGATRVMCEKFGVWARGLEEDPQLVEAGMALSTKAGMAKRAPIEGFDPESLELKPKSIDCIFSKEYLYRVEHKRELLRTLEGALKGRGQLLFTDYVLAKAHGSSDLLEAWKESEPSPPHLWSVQDYENAFGKLHLDIRVIDDITEAFHKMVTTRWAAYMLSIKTHGLDDDLASCLMEEVERWTRRMQLLESDEVHICRFHVVKKDTNRLLSNW